MLLLFLSIVSNVALLIVIKLLERFAVPGIQAIFYNYLIAALAAFLIIDEPWSIHELLNSGYFYFAALMGVFFVLNLYFITLSAQKISIAVATVANKMSLVVPVSLAFLIYNDSLTPIKLVGIIIAITSIFLSLYSPTTGNKKNRAFIFPILVFIISGTIDSILSHTGQTLIISAKDNALFTGLSFAFAGVFCGLWLLLRVINKQEKWSAKAVGGGLFIGIFNFLTIYLILRTIDSKYMESSALFPIMNIGVLVLISIVGILFLKEKLSKINYIGLALSVLAILLISYGALFSGFN